MIFTHELNPETLEWMPCNYTSADFIELVKLGNYPGIGDGFIMWEATPPSGDSKKLLSPLWD